MARKTRTPKTASAALAAEIAANDAAAPSVIDHHTQYGSWAHSYMAEAHVADAPSDADLSALAELDAVEPVESATETLSAEDAAVLETAELMDEVRADAERVETVEPETVAQTDDFATILASFDDDAVLEMAHKIAAAIDDRVAFEDAKNPENSSIQRTLTKVRKELVSKRAARVLLATRIEPTFVNRTLHDGSRYNVYALGKLADLIRALADGAGLGNAINNAVTRSLFRCKNAGVTFTGEIARAAASNKLRIDPTIASRLVRHTVSASTAPTQASSTMSALTTLGVVRTEGSQRNPTYLVTDNPVAKFLEAKLLAA